ncbi:MAG: hypothetical protein AAF311_09755 [Pseudomonadota bacterium]
MRLTQTENGTAAPRGAGPSAPADRSRPGQLSAQGDDLARARLFTLKAGAAMSAIVEADRDAASSGRKAPGRDPLWLCERLSVIQREAKRARARAVYRSAQDALSLIQRCNVHMPIDWTRVDGRLFVLNKLLAQYENGLSELERLLPAPRTAHAKPDHGKPETASPFDPAHQIAKDTLRCLLPHADATERAALERLIDMDPPAPAGTAQQGPQPLAKTVAQEEARQDEIEALPKADRLEWIMPDLVQRLLETGRQYGKLFSVSHTLDEVLIEAGTGDAVHERLFAGLHGLVAADLPLQGVGRLDLALEDGRLVVTGSGFAPVVFDLPERIDPDACADHGGAPAPDAAPARRITDDTEAALRAQLGALMEGGLEFPGNSAAQDEGGSA